MELVVGLRPLTIRERVNCNLPTKNGKSVAVRHFQLLNFKPLALTQRHTHSLTHSFTYSRIYPLTHSLTIIALDSTPHQGITLLCLQVSLSSLAMLKPGFSEQVPLPHSPTHSLTHHTTQFNPTILFIAGVQCHETHRYRRLHHCHYCLHYCLHYSQHHYLIE